MGDVGLLYKTEYDITDKIKIIIPTVGQILENELAYYGTVSTITAMPIDLMCQLADIGIDFTEINEYELFLLTFRGLCAQDTSLIFGDLDLTKFRVATSEQNNNLVLLDTENDIVIDRAVHDKIARVLRTIHHMEKDVRKPGNNAAKKYMLERARKKLERQKRKKVESQLEPLIIAMVNTHQYKYDFEGTRELTIYQFNESVRQVIKKVDYENKMHGVYSGTVSIKDLSQDDLNWLTNK